MEYMLPTLDQASFTASAISPRNLPAASVPRWWAALAVATDLSLPLGYDDAHDLLRGVVQRRANTATDPVVRGVWCALDARLDGGEGDETVDLLLHAIGAPVPPPPTLPPPRRRRWTAADMTAPPWLRLVGSIDLTVPQRPSDRAFAERMRPKEERLTAAQQIQPRDRIGPIGAEGDRARAEAEERRRSIPDLERGLADERELHRRAVSDWSEAFDSVRRKCLASIDHAIASGTVSPLERFALDQLGRDGRRCEPGRPGDPAQRLPLVIRPDEALSVIIGAVRLEPQPDPISTPEPRCVACVGTARLKGHDKPLTRRSRAGFAFGPTPRTIDCTELEYDEICADSALVIVDEGSRAVQTQLAAAQAQLAATEARLAAAEARLAAARPLEHESQANEPRRKSRGKASVDPALDADDDDLFGGGGGQ